MSDAGIPADRSAADRRRAYRPRTADDVRSGFGSPRDHQPSPEADVASQMREDESVERVTRKTRGERQVNRFSIPAHRKKPGWDYQWWVHRVVGEVVDGSALAEVYEGGWRPVPASDMPELRVPGYDSDYIESFGQRLYMRPMYLTQQAKQEDYSAAEQQRIDRIQSAAGGRADGGAIADVRGVQVREPEVGVQTEIGTYNNNPLGGRAR